MFRLPPEGALSADVLNAAWWVRHYPRRHQAGMRAQAVARLAATVRAALESAQDDESVLYAVAIGLYEAQDPRFIP